jgi:putative phosphoribosyl transferase
MKFKNRIAAGQRLAAELTEYARRSDVVVLALPRGGVPVAFEVARLLGVALDVFLVRKLGVPGQEELAMGAIASGGVRVLNGEVMRLLHLSEETLERVAEKEQQELERREQLYRGDRPAPELHQRTVILVDDGLATGSTMRAAVLALRQQQPEQIVVATPVASPEICRNLQAEVDRVFCVMKPQPFHSISLWYQDFSQTTDEEVHTLLEQAAIAFQQSTVTC